MADLTYQDVIGKNLRRLREKRGMTQEELAVRAAREYELRWRQQTVQAIESGRRPVSIGAMLLLSRIFEMKPADLLEELLNTDAEVVDVEGLALEGKTLEAFAAGRPSKRSVTTTLDLRWHVSDRHTEAVLSRHGLTDGDFGRVMAWARGDLEYRTARRLGVEPIEVAAAAAALWGRNITEERDRRLARQEITGELSAHRGHITRELHDELADRIKNARKRKNTHGRKRA